MLEVKVALMEVGGDSRLKDLTMHFIFLQFECCGVQGPSDYDGKIPMSCCIASRSSCNAMEFREDEIYTSVSQYTKIPPVVYQQTATEPATLSRGPPELSLFCFFFLSVLGCFLVVNSGCLNK